MRGRARDVGGGPAADHDQAETASANPGRPRRGACALRLALVFLFAIGMAFVEAVVVVYIRHLLGIVPTPVQVDEKVIQAVLDRTPWLIPTEQWREAATLVMLGSFGYLVGRDGRERWGVFLYAFGWWDLFYYVWLWALIRWPPSLFTIDVLFLIPIPWIAPVLLPVSIAAGMVLGGGWLVWSPTREKGGEVRAA